MVAFCEAAHFCTFCICASCKHNLECRIFFLSSSIYKVKHIESVAAGVCFLIKIWYKIPSHGLITHCSIAPYAVIKFTALCLYVLLLTKRGIQNSAKIMIKANDKKFKKEGLLPVPLLPILYIFF